MTSFRNDQRSAEAGSGTVAVVGVIVAALILIAVVPLLGAIHTRMVMAQAVADLSALAGADVSAVATLVDLGARPCERAAAVAQANDATLLRCEVHASDVLVEVGIPLPAALSVVAGTGQVSGRAQAGVEEPP